MHEQPYLLNSLVAPLCTLLGPSSQVLLHTQVFYQNLSSEGDGKTTAQVSDVRLHLKGRQLRKKKVSLYLQAMHSRHQAPER